VEVTWKGDRAVTGLSARAGDGDAVKDAIDRQARINGAEYDAKLPEVTLPKSKWAKAINAWRMKN